MLQGIDVLSQIISLDVLSEFTFNDRRYKLGVDCFAFNHNPPLFPITI